MKACQTITLTACTATLLIGCAGERTSRKSETLEATAAAVTRPDGTVGTVAPSTDQVANVRRVNAEMMSVNERFPPPPIPASVPPLHRVAAVTPEGVISLENGMLVRLDGVGCSKEGISDLSRLLRSPEVSVAFIEPPTPGIQPTPVQLWVVQDVAEDKTKPIITYNRIAESALLSGWCTPLKTPTSTTYDRYLAIAAIAAAKAN
jgi:hypothetical protein